MEMETTTMSGRWSWGLCRIGSEGQGICSEDDVMAVTYSGVTWEGRRRAHRINGGQVSFALLRTVRSHWQGTMADSSNKVSWVSLR